MNESTTYEKEGMAASARADLQRRPQGFIAFCETNLRYEKGPKAWIVLLPYLIGAVILERTTIQTQAGWIAFLGYLVLFPSVLAPGAQVASENRTPAFSHGYPPIAEVVSKIHWINMVITY